MRRGERQFILAWGGTAILFCTAWGQFKEQGCELGMSGGGAMGWNEAGDHPIEPQARFILAFPLLDRMQGEFGFGLALNSGEGYAVDLMPIDYRFRFALLPADRWIPYVYAGAGMLYYDVGTQPANLDTTMDLWGWTGFLPYGAGLQFRADERWSFELSGGGHFTFSDALNPVKQGDDENNDGYLTFGLGIRCTLGGGD